MCIIVDNNVVHRVLGDPTDPDFSPIYKALFSSNRPRAIMVYGGRLGREYSISANIRRLVAILDRAGRATLVPDSEVDDEEAVVAKLGLCVSDDAHIVALARISGVRLLCSHDKPLHKDFTNRSLISNPRGKVYQNTTHSGLLRAACS